MKIADRQKKYTPEYYRKFKDESGLRWCDVPFICHACGKEFKLKKVKPKKTPKYCCVECRADMFDGSALGKISSAKLNGVNWEEVRDMIKIGKTSTHISKHHKICVVSIHKHVKKRYGTALLEKLIENGKKARKRGQMAALAKEM